VLCVASSRVILQLFCPWRKHFSEHDESRSSQSNVAEEIVTGRRWGHSLQTENALSFAQRSRLVRQQAHSYRPAHVFLFANLTHRAKSGLTAYKTASTTRSPEEGSRTDHTEIEIRSSDAACRCQKAPERDSPHYNSTKAVGGGGLMVLRG
jgi:hypothetical protein